MDTIEFNYSDRLQHYLTNLIIGLRSIFKTEYFEYISETTNCNPGFTHFIQDFGIDCNKWLQDGLEESSNQFLLDLYKILNNRLHFNIDRAEAIIEECNHYTQILSHFPQLERWKDQIDQYKFEVSLLHCAYRLHRQMLVDVHVSTNSKQVQKETMQTLITALNRLNHHQPLSLLKFIHLFSKQLLVITSDKNYQAQLQKANDPTYINLYEQLRSALTSWREMLSNTRNFMLEKSLDNDGDVVTEAQTEQQKRVKQEEYSKTFEACDINYNQLKILHNQDSFQSISRNMNPTVPNKIDSKRVSAKKHSSQSAAFFASNDRTAQSTLPVRYR